MSTLNSQQAEAVNLTAKKILCLAGAGTGKTFSMISRISRLVDEGVDPSSILVLTFTNAAAFEMQQRYRKSHMNQQMPNFRTFHSYCYSLIATDPAIRKSLGYSKVPNIADEYDMQKLSQTALMQSGVHLSKKQIQQGNNLSIQQEYELDLYKKFLDKLLKQENLITFDILCYSVCDLFVKDAECIRNQKEQYKYIFVDEFQDTDPRQYDFVSSFKDANLFVVGDALQAIYSFRGADSSIIKRLANDPEWVTVKLYQNYRSTKPICNFANRMSTYADKSYRIEIASDKDGPTVFVDDGSMVSWNEPVDGIHCESVAVSLTECKGTSAVLCRTNAEVDYMIEFLESRGISCRTGKRNVDATHILKSVLDNRYMIDWLSTFLNANKYAEYIRISFIEDYQNPLQGFLENFGSARGIEERASCVLKIRSILKAPGKLAFQRCSDILNVLDIKNVIIDTNAITVAEILDYLMSVVNEEESSDIYVGTIHSSKGLEYDNVFLLGVGDKSFKLNSEDNKNLYYVGITRAKTNLYVYTV